MLSAWLFLLWPPPLLPFISVICVFLSPLLFAFSCAYFCLSVLHGGRPLILIMCCWGEGVQSIVTGRHNASHTGLKGAFSISIMMPRGATNNEPPLINGPAVLSSVPLPCSFRRSISVPSSYFLLASPHFLFPIPNEGLTHRLLLMDDSVWLMILPGCVM